MDKSYGHIVSFLAIQIFFFLILREKPSCEVITVQFIFTVDVRELEVMVGGGKGP